MSQTRQAAWVRYTLRCATNAEEEGYKAIEAGAAGVEIIGDQSLHCYVANPHHEFGQAIEELGFTVVEVRAVNQENWVQSCADLFKPLLIGGLKVMPIACAADAPTEEKRAKDELYLIPGLGFGTGHHAATRLALELLQSLQDIPKNVLDIGTGSGILAIAAHRLYHCPVDAIDVDPLAIENAIENVAINGCDSAITMHEGGVERAASGYDLVLANLYAELLISLEQDIRTHAAAGASIVVSGIMSHLAPQVHEIYSPRWDLVTEKTSEGWYAAIFRRR